MVPWFMLKGIQVLHRGFHPGRGKWLFWAHPQWGIYGAGMFI